jgi:hypothetical protein
MSGEEYFAVKCEAALVLQEKERGVEGAGSACCMVAIMNSVARQRARSKVNAFKCQKVAKGHDKCNTGRS